MPFQTIHIDLSEYFPPTLFENVTSVDGLIRGIAAHRERPIITRPYSFPLGYYGARFATPHADYILYEAQTPQPHQWHIMCHELAHILARHPVQTITSPAALAELAPVVLLRSSLDTTTAEEQEAEAIAYAIQTELIRRAGLRALTGVPSTTLWQGLITWLGLDI